MRSVALSLVFAAFAASVGLGCREEGPAERAGRAIDEAGEDASEAFDEAIDAVEEAAEEARQKAREALE